MLLNPELAMDTIQRMDVWEQDTLISAAFRTWVQSDVRAAVEKAKGLSGVQQIYAFQALLRPPDILPQQVRNELTELWHMQNYLNYLIYQALTTDINDDPRTKILQLQDDTERNYAARMNTLTEIAYQWYRRDGVIMLPELYDLLQTDKLKRSILSALLRRLAYESPQQALTIIDSLPAEAKTQQYEYQLFRSWAYQDAETEFAVARERDARRAY